MKRKAAIDGIVYRQYYARAETASEEDRTVELSFSSEQPVLRRSYFRDPWIEILSHDEKDVDLSRLNNGAALLYNHGWAFGGDDPARLGVVEHAELKGKRGKARVRFSKREAVDGTWQDVRDGILVNVSVGYMIDERLLVREGKDGEPDEYRVKWTPMEISIVDVPADHTVGIGRKGGEVMEGIPPHLIKGERASEDFFYRVLDREPGHSAGDQQEQAMEPSESEQSRNAPPANGGTPATPAAPAVDVEAERKRAVEEYRKLERERCDGIRAAFELHPGFDDLQQRCLNDESCTVDAARGHLLDAIGKRSTPSGDGHVEAGRDSRDGFRKAAFLSIAERASSFIKVDPKERPEQNELRGLSLLELARRALIADGHRADGGRMEVVGRAFVTSGSFQNILYDAAHKSLLTGWMENPETWRDWTRAGNLSDFKIAHRVNMSNFSDLLLIPEGAEYEQGVLMDSRETIQLAKFGRLYSLTREAIINDDLDAFTRIPANMGRAAARVPGDLSYAVLTINGNMSDGTALFHADHSNLGTPGAISITTVGQLRQLMAMQTDPNGVVIGSRLARLLVPLELEDTANQLRTSEYDPASTTNSRAPNTVRNTFEVTSDHRLSTDSATTYYGVANPNQSDTVEVAFLDGVQEPAMEQKQGWNVDGTEFKVRLECGASALDHRAMTRNTTS